MKFVAVLVCFSPSQSTRNVSEYTLYQIISSIAVVKNVKIINKSKPIKAFVQLENIIAADMVIQHLHDQSLKIGKFRVYKSDKTFIALEKTLKQVLQEGESQPKLTSDDLIKVSDDHAKTNSNVLKTVYVNEGNTLMDNYINKTKYRPGELLVDNFVTGSNLKMPRGMIKGTSSKGCSSNKSMIDSKNNLINNNFCSEIIARGSKKLCDNQKSIYIKAETINENTVEDFLNNLEVDQEILDIEFENTRNILFIDFKSKASAQNTINQLNKIKYRGCRLTVGLCESFSNLLQTSHDSDMYDKMQAKDMTIPQQNPNDFIKEYKQWNLEFSKPPTSFRLEDFVHLVGSVKIPISITEACHKITGEKVFNATFKNGFDAIDVFNKLRITNGIEFANKLKMVPL